MIFCCLRLDGSFFVVFCTCAKSDKHGEVPERVQFRLLLSQFLQFRLFAEKHPPKPSSEARVCQLFCLDSLAAMSWGAGDRSQQDLWSALVAVAEAEMEDIEFLMVRLQDSDLEKIRQAAQAALVASSRLQAAEREMASSSHADNPAKAVPKVVAKGSADDGQVATAEVATTASGSTTVASQPGTVAGPLSKKASRGPPPGPTFAKDTSPGTAAATKAMAAKPVPVKPLPADPWFAWSAAPVDYDYTSEEDDSGQVSA